MGVPCPSAADRKRNPHRPGKAWRQRTVTAIVANPRYTGRQVWNRQQTNHYPTDDAVPGMTRERKLAPSQQWAISDKPAHEALISEQDFVAAQNITARTQPTDGSSRTYLLTGLLRCATCGRSMDPQSTHGNPAHSSAYPTDMRQSANLYLREDVIIGRILAHLHTLTSRDAEVRDDIARLQQNRNTADLIRFLRAHNIMIECGATRVSLEPDPEKSIIVRPPANAPQAERQIPRQRTQQQKQKRGIVHD